MLIPREIRKSLALESGQKLQAIRYNDRIKLIPIWSIKRARGFLAGIDTHIEREADRLQFCAKIP